MIDQKKHSSSDKSKEEPTDYYNNSIKTVLLKRNGHKKNT
jgi:hypothetical protein